MSFIDTLFDNLHAHPERPVIVEIHGETQRPHTGAEISAMVASIRGSLRSSGLASGDRVALVAPNSARWYAADLAILAEGLVVVPMYARQATSELATMMSDCGASLVICAAELREAIREVWSGPVATLDEAIHTTPVVEPPAQRSDDDVVTLIYTSGTSGPAKGVMLSAGNVDYMLPVTAGTLNDLMGSGGDSGRQDRVFHYLPFCFAGSRIVLWTTALRANPLMISTDLNNLLEELGTARPEYFLNVPALLDRIRVGVEAKVDGRGALISWLWGRGKCAWEAKQRGTAGTRDAIALRLARRLMFDKIRHQIGPRLQFLICGSAPLSEATQRWFQMLGIRVYQVYGLTETTAIVTMDEPEGVVPGRVGHPIKGTEVRLGDGDELQVRGPGVFKGYWGRDAATQEAFDDGWFRTGDQARVDATGNWAVVGRVRNLLVPSSGHNVPPEPLEQGLMEHIAGVEQAVVVGHGRPFLAAILTGTINAAEADDGVERLNATLPHYKRIRKFHLSKDLFTPDNGLLTANQKLKREAIEAHYAHQVEAMYT